MACKATHHSSLWFDDGNVVLLVSSNHPDTPDSLFRVHKSVLSKHSDVFRGMFTLPTPNYQGDLKEDPNDMYDGTPLIRMPDTVEQIESMLKGFYEPLYLEFDSRNPDLPLQLTPLMTMVRKYEIKGIESHLEKQIKAAWPKNLDEWNEIDLKLAELPVAGPLDAWPHSLLPEPASAIVFARQFSIDCILPAAFYDLSRCSYYKNWPGSRTDVNFYPYEKGARWSLLSTQDLIRLAQLKESLNALLPNARIKCCDQVTACEGGEKCQSTIKDLFDKIISPHRQANCPDLLYSLSWTDGELRDQYSICRSCSEVFSGKLHDIRNETWVKVLDVVNND